MSARTGGFRDAACLLWLLYAVACFDRACSQVEVTITSVPVLPALLGDALTLTCMLNVPGATKIEWDRVNDTSSGDLSAGTSTLTIPTVLSADLGNYTCTATVGGDVFSSTITVMGSVSAATMNFIPLSAPPFYTGAELIVFCDVFIPSSVNADTDLTLIMEVSYEKDGMTLSNNGRLTIEGLQNFGPLPAGVLYRSQLVISPLVQTSDLGQWICKVDISSENMFVVLASLSSDYFLNENMIPALLFSFPTASVEPAFVRSPDVYQQEITFSCNGTVDMDLVVNKEIIWLVDDIETSNGVSPITNPMDMLSISELLALTPSDSGTYNYTCLVIVDVEGDPELHDSATALVTVTAPANPNPPVSLAALNVAHNAATISWTVTEIAYTNESYVVRYGTDMNDLALSSAPAEVGTNFLEINQQFQIMIVGLELNTKYYFIVEAINSEGNTSSMQGMFMTLELPPSAPPSSFSVTSVGSTYVYFSWNPPPSEFQNGAIVSYTLNCDSSVPEVMLPTFTHYYQSESFTSGGGVETNITTFSPGITYVCSVLATNGAGNSPVATLNVTAIEKLPIGEPLNFTVMASGPCEITFSWEPPSFEKQLGIIKSYNLTCVSARDDGITMMSYMAPQSSLKLDGFSPATMYNCTVSASNSVGSGPPAFGMTTTNPDIPGAGPAGFVVLYNETNPTMLTLTWMPVPEDSRNGMITAYVFSCNSSDGSKGTVMANPITESINERYSQPVDGLEPNTYYTCKVHARNVVGDGQAAQATNVTAMNLKSDSSAVVVIGAIAGIIGIIIAAVFGVLILMLILRHRYTRRKMCNGMMVDEMVPLPDEKCISVINEEKVVNEASHYSEIESPAKIEERLKVIPKSAFSQHVREMHEKREKGFEDEYGSLPNDSPTDSCESAKLPVNRPKNKFANICPYESSRVKLQHVDGEEGSDYINASYIDGYLHENTYIAAQGPMQNTLTDFWRMVVEHRLTNIVMLTKVVEAGKRKCEQYWPDNPKEYKDFGHGIRVELVSHTPYADFDMRKMIVTQAGSIAEPLEVIHWQFLGWPDHGVPKFATSLISFIRHVRHEYKKSKTTTPMLVHCSAGVGRTGTFILLDYMLERLVHEDTINIHDFLISMRNRRVLMVQTLAQYVFIHDTLDELITCGETDISIHKFKNSIAHLHKQIPGRGTTGFETQFKLLEEVCRKPLRNECTDARQTYNDHKNRYSDRLPYDVGRARLKPIGGQGADYINASFIDGYKTRNSYIATQGPLLSTITDFWRMIWEWKSKCIIMLCNLEENSLESSALYWPEKVGEPLKQGNRLVVTLLEENVKKDYIVRKMELKDSTVQGSSFVVTHFHFTEWPENSLPVSCTGLLSMLEEVNRTQRTTGNKPITVMCNDGMGRTGTLICLHVQQERMKTEGVLDVFHFIKSARIHRPKLVTTLEQYIFCHEAIEKFLDMFDVYCNFK